MGRRCARQRTQRESDDLIFIHKNRQITVQMFTLAEQRRGEQAGRPRAPSRGDAGSCILAAMENVGMLPPAERAFPEFFWSSVPCQ